MALESSPAGQIQEFLRVLRRRRWQIALPALFVLTFGACFAVLVPKRYVVDTRVAVRESRNPLDYELKFSQQTTVARELAAVREHIINFARVERIVGEDLIGLWPEYERAEREERADMIRRILGNISVFTAEKNRSEGTTFIDLTYKDVDLERAKAFLDRLKSLWIEELIERTESNLETEREVLSEAVKVAREDYRLANERYVEQCREMEWNPAEPPDPGFRTGSGAGDFVYDQLADFKKDSVDLRERLQRAKTELATLEERWRSEPTNVRQVEIEPGQGYATERAELEGHLDELRRQLSEVTRHNRRYPALVEDIAQAEQDLEQLAELETTDNEVALLVPNENKERLRLALADKESEVRTLSTALERIEDNIEEYEERVARRGEDFGLLRNLYYDVEAARQEKAQAERDLREKELSISTTRRANDDVYQVVARPDARDPGTEPSAALIVLFSLFAGLALGLVVALLAEYARGSYRTVSDLADVMTVPVLGSIGTIVTRFEARRRFLQRMTVGVSSAVILLGVSWITWTWHSSPEKLPIPMQEAIEGFRLMLM